MELFSTLQETYGNMLRQVLEYIDQELAKHRDKNRYCLKDKQTVRIQMLFEEAEVQRNNYFDRETSVYTCLLDHFLRFDGEESVRCWRKQRWNWQWRIHCIVKAVETLEKMVGYAVMSHETGSEQLKSYAGIQYPQAPIYQALQALKGI